MDAGDAPSRSTPVTSAPNEPARRRTLAVTSCPPNDSAKHRLTHLDPAARPDSVAVLHRGSTLVGRRAHTRGRCCRFGPNANRAFLPLYPHQNRGIIQLRVARYVAVRAAPIRGHEQSDRLDRELRCAGRVAVGGGLAIRARRCCSCRPALFSERDRQLIRPL